jgi:YggT family protein
VPTVTAALATVIVALRYAFFAGASVAAVVCAVDWLVRTRRLNPFNPVARFFRQNVDPLLAPVERRIVAAGGLPTNAPLWALGGIILGGIVILTLLEFLLGQIDGVTRAVQGGPRGILRLVVAWTFAILRLALIVRVISSWVRVSPYSPWVRWSFTLSEPILRPLRQIIPSIGMIDITPIAAYFVLVLLESFIQRIL